jgi:hypothetical protein
VVGDDVTGVKALVWRGPNRMTVDNVPEPRPKAGEAVAHPDTFATLAKGTTDDIKVFLGA